MIGIGDEIVRLLVAAVLGALIGLERERLDRGAGLRTHALVSTGAALVIIVSAFGFADALEPGRIVLDPSRVAAQVVSGIGFLGAGTIILRRDAIRGLTTAASIWAVASIGLAAGAGLYAPAVAATAILLLILLGLRPVERHFFAHKRIWRMTITAAREPGQVAAIEAGVVASALELSRLYLEPSADGSGRRIRLDLEGPAGLGLAQLAEALHGVAGVRAVSYRGNARRPATSDAEDEDDADGPR